MTQDSINEIKGIAASVVISIIITAAIYIPLATADPRLWRCW